MKFNQIVEEELLPLLATRGFKIVQQHENYFRIQSDFVAISLGYNNLENNCIARIGRVNGTLYTLNNKAIDIIFHSKAKIDNISKEEFVKNVVYFFRNEGYSTLMNDFKKLDELEKFSLAEAKEYTKRYLR